MQSVLDGHDTIAVMPTGSGKSLCYQLPALCMEGIVVVITPLIALMRDQVQSLREIGIAAGCLHSGQKLEDKRQVFAEIETQHNYILYLSPERVQTPGFAVWLCKQKISLFVVDEAHCVSHWGPEFRQDYHKLNILRQLKTNVPILALTASATQSVIRDIVNQLKMHRPSRHVHGFYRPNLYYQVEICEDDAEKWMYLVQALKQVPEGRILIYCGTRKQCEKLAEALREDFPETDCYHAGLTPSRRTQIQEDFDQERIRILVATNAFGMGVDYPDVRLVAHFQIPGSIENYYQEAGRAGRDGKPAVCLLLYAKRDRGLQAYFIHQSEATPRVIRQRWISLDAVCGFATGRSCRAKTILNYFGERDVPDLCGNCDSCAPNSKLRIHEDEPGRTQYAGASPELRH